MMFLSALLLWCHICCILKASPPTPKDENWRSSDQTALSDSESKSSSVDEFRLVLSESDSEDSDETYYSQETYYSPAEGLENNRESLQNLTNNQMEVEKEMIMQSSESDVILISPECPMVVLSDSEDDGNPKPTTSGQICKNRVPLSSRSRIVSSSDDSDDEPLWNLCISLTRSQQNSSRPTAQPQRKRRRQVPRGAWMADDMEKAVRGGGASISRNSRIYRIPESTLRAYRNYYKNDRRRYEELIANKRLQERTKPPKRNNGPDKDGWYHCG